jgi:RNA polymerase II subunit A C-terminal domain phosphatase
MSRFAIPRCSVFNFALTAINQSIIPRLRSEVFDGVHLVFSGVIPIESNNLPINPESTEIWRIAIRFGAQCHRDMTDAVTHVVATPEGVEVWPSTVTQEYLVHLTPSQRRTSKINAARARGIPIVSISWFHDSIALWKRLDERPYSFDLRTAAEQGGPASASSPLMDHQSSSDIEPDTDDWDSDVERAATPAGGTAAADPILLGELAWDDINDEVDAAMMDSDEEDNRTEGDAKSVNGSEDEWSEETNSVIRYVGISLLRKRC